MEGRRVVKARLPFAVRCVHLSRCENISGESYQAANQTSALRVYTDEPLAKGKQVITSEQELIQRAQSGDTDAFCRLAESYQRRNYLLALHYCRNPHDAQDLSQEVWLKAFKAIRSFRGDASFQTWLRQITINTFLNHRRGLAASNGNGKMTISLDELDAPDELLPVSVADVEDRLHHKILVEKVMHALGELTDQQRLMFLLKHREGMTYEEISQALGCSAGTVKKSLFRTVIKLRASLCAGVGANTHAPTAAGENG